MSVAGFHNMGFPPPPAPKPYFDDRELCWRTPVDWTVLREHGREDPIGWVNSDGNVVYCVGNGARKNIREPKPLPTFEQWLVADTDQTYQEWIMPPERPEPPQNRLYREGVGYMCVQCEKRKASDGNRCRRCAGWSWWDRWNVR